MLIFYLNSLLFFRFLYKYIQIDKHHTAVKASIKKLPRVPSLCDDYMYFSLNILLASIKQDSMQSNRLCTIVDV